MRSIVATWPQVRRAWREAMVILHSARRLGDVSGSINRKVMIAGDGLRKAVDTLLEMDGLGFSDRLALRQCRNGLPMLVARLIDGQGDPLSFELFGDVEAIAEDVLARKSAPPIIRQIPRKPAGRFRIAPLDESKPEGE